MKNRRYALPSMSALVAFEAVARRKGFARAAEELNTSQPAISRHIRNLEIRFGISLFERDGQRIRLTRQGERFYANVAQALDGLQESVGALRLGGDEVTLACSHAVSHLLLMPKYRGLRHALGPKVQLQFLTTEYGLLRPAIDTGADIVFEYGTTAPKRDHVVVGREVVKPVGTPKIVAQAEAALANSSEPPGLLSLHQENHGWAGWEDWMTARPDMTGWPVAERLDNYVFLLETAAAGGGLALGWRMFVNPYMERGELVELPVDWLETETKFYARLTRFGEQNPAARRCLALLADFG